MPTLQERTVIDLGQGSYVVCLPKPWLKYYGIKPGDKVVIEANGELTIMPKGIRKKRKQGNFVPTMARKMRPNSETEKRDMPPALLRIAAIAWDIACDAVKREAEEAVKKEGKTDE